MLKFQVLALFSISTALLDWQSVVSAGGLPAYNVDGEAISVSGISSGAAMAVQLHVAFSSTFMGVGLIAGAPYMCSPHDVCTRNPSQIDVSALETLTATAERLGNIDPTTNMNNDKVWIFAGALDSVVNPIAGSKAAEYYRHYVSNPSQVLFVNNIQAQHAMITNNYGASCDSLTREGPHINNCGYSAAFHLLNHIYGNLVEPQPDYQTTGTVYYFFQTPYAMMDALGYIYVPRRCQDKSVACKLHIALHGCLMERTRIGLEFVNHGGYNQVADLNDIIVLYPQSIKSTANPLGCWDWYGYTGAMHAYHQGPQMQAIYTMINQVRGL